MLNDRERLHFHWEEKVQQRLDCRPPFQTMRKPITSVRRKRRGNLTQRLKRRGKGALEGELHGRYCANSGSVNGEGRVSLSIMTKEKGGDLSEKKKKGKERDRFKEGEKKGASYPKRSKTLPF